MVRESQLGLKISFEHLSVKKSLVGLCDLEMARDKSIQRSTLMPPMAESNSQKSSSQVTPLDAILKRLLTVEEKAQDLQSQSSVRDFLIFLSLGLSSVSLYKLLNKK